ncbi:3-phosphoshikimate 1-carboxyvinyltransferase [Schaalia sp. ZJ1691]|uniref:3-phosphoshikimate 1-carboxyvinyltransferase n=1 Tax=Schaalia sp. ZJ1691 TaxID=2709404 RepID=UPI001F150E23|nr:3-phosphoshikimate 1-carboxyvinyltransferase [Schaalia sp. ZJ1691]
MNQAWPAPVASGPVNARVRVPGSKSHTARALYLAAIATHPSRIRGALDARDTRLFINGLQALGARISSDGDALLVEPISNHEMPPADSPTGSAPGKIRTIDVGLAGTVMRFLPPLAALSSTPTRFTGDEAALHRPVAPLLDALTSMGASVDYEGEAGHLPLTIRGPLHVPEDGCVDVHASSSSQFLSAMLLVAPLLSSPITVRAPGNVVSLPHVDMTVSAMRARGIRCVRSGDAGQDLSWVVEPGRPEGGTWTIEPDLSNAGPFLAAAMVTGGSVTIPNWPSVTDQAGDAWRWILKEMGGIVRFTPGASDGKAEAGDLTVTGPPRGNLRGLSADFSAIGELVPTVAALAAVASSPSLITGIAHLRGHETDRVSALAREITRLGGDVNEGDDFLRITPRPLHAAEIHTYEDHRMATFGAIIGLNVPGTHVANVETTSKTLPGFTTMWEDMLSQ